MLLKLQSQLPDRPAAAELDADAVDIVGNDMCVCYVCARARVVSFLSDRFAPPLCGLCLEFGAHIGRSRCLRAKLRPVV